LRSIVRRDTGEGYQEFLIGLAKASGIETPTREDLARIDRKRAKKGSNEDWKNPFDPDAKITKMKDGRTHLAHKAEHAVDMETGAVVVVTLQPADRGDTASLEVTLDEAMAVLSDVIEDEEATEGLSDEMLSEVVADKGYHSNATLLAQARLGLRTYISEPKRGRRNWKNQEAAQEAVYANRRRVKGRRGKRLMRQRGELIERSFAHCYETGNMRRTHLRGHPNILKRLLIHVAGFNLGLLMRQLCSIGKPRVLQGLSSLLLRLFFAFLEYLKPLWRPFEEGIARSLTIGLTRCLLHTPSRSISANFGIASRERLSPQAARSPSSHRILQPDVLPLALAAFEAEARRRAEAFEEVDRAGLQDERNDQEMDAVHQARYGSLQRAPAARL
jgi:transposase